MALKYQCDDCGRYFLLWPGKIGVLSTELGKAIVWADEHHECAPLSAKKVPA